VLSSTAEGTDSLPKIVIPAVRCEAVE
jgi:hypothetical protein